MASLRVGVVDDLGLRGTKGDKGDPGSSGGGGVGPGVAAGGTAGQVLAKIDGTDYHTHWVDPAAGGGGSVDSWADVEATPDFPAFLAQGATAAAARTAIGAGTSSLALGTSGSTALAGNTPLDQVADPTADVTMNGHKITGGADGVADTDFATIGQMDEALDQKLDLTALFAQVVSLFNGVTISKDYDDVADTWPTLNSTLAASAGVAWLFGGADESTPPPTSIAGPAKWVRNL